MKDVEDVLFAGSHAEMHVLTFLVGQNDGKLPPCSPLVSVLFILWSVGGLGADSVKCVSSAGHHQPGAECYDPAYCRQPCSQLSGTAAPQQEPQSPGNTVVICLVYTLQ